MTTVEFIRGIHIVYGLVWIPEWAQAYQVVHLCYKILTKEL